MHGKGRKWTCVIYQMIINNTVVGVCDVNPSSMSAKNNWGCCSLCVYLIYKTLLIVSLLLDNNCRWIITLITSKYTSPIDLTVKLVLWQIITNPILFTCWHSFKGPIQLIKGSLTPAKNIYNLSTISEIKSIWWRNNRSVTR